MLWVEILNRGPESLVTETMGALETRAAEALRRDYEVLRWVCADRVLGASLPAPIRAAMASWLAAVRVRPEPPQRWQGFGLPALRARRDGAVLPPDLESLVSTALLQLSSAASVTGVSRCHGVRQAGEATVWGDALDAAFLDAAHLDRWLGRGWRQCPRLVFGQRGGRYCSKACSNAGFAARKGARDPGYFAAKQAQYRDRQRRRSAARVDDAGVLFVD